MHSGAAIHWHGCPRQQQRVLRCGSCPLRLLSWHTHRVARPVKAAALQDNVRAAGRTLGIPNNVHPLDAACSRARVVRGHKPHVGAAAAVAAARIGGGCSRGRHAAGVAATAEPGDTVTAGRKAGSPPRRRLWVKACTDVHAAPAAAACWHEWCWLRLFGRLPIRTRQPPCLHPAPGVHPGVQPYGCSPAQLELSEAWLYDASTMNLALLPLASEEDTMDVGGHGALQVHTFSQRQMINAKQQRQQQ